MERRITLAPKAGVQVNLYDDSLHVTAGEAKVRGPAIARAGRETPTARRRRGGIVWPTFLRVDVGDPHAADLKMAPSFESFEALAKDAAITFGRSAPGERVFARVRAGGAVPMARIQETLNALPRDSELVVQVELDGGK